MPAVPDERIVFLGPAVVCLGSRKRTKLHSSTTARHVRHRAKVLPDERAYHRGRSGSRHPRCRNNGTEVRLKAQAPATFADGRLDPGSSNGKKSLHDTSKTPRLVHFSFIRTPRSWKRDNRLREHFNTNTIAKCSS